ncbi:Hypothetical protein NocV09_07200060 [Nannochloropsis oceanica]
MLAFRGVGTKLGLHRLPVSSTRPVLVSLPYHASQQQTRGVTKSGRSSKGTETSTTTNSSNSANGTSTATRKRKGRDAGPPINAAFFKVDGANPPAVEGTGTAEGDGWVVGEVTDHAINLHDVRPGEVIDIPYELTISPSFRDFWQSVFYSHDRLNTSTPFARKLGFQDQVLPFSLMLFLTGSMSHADSATVQVGFKNGIYHWPAFAGDTITKRFIIRSVRTVSSNKYSVFSFSCELKNQRDQVIFTAEKSMIFPVVLPPSDVAFPVPIPPRHLEEHLVSRADSLHILGSQSLQSLRPGQLLLHSLARPLSASQSMQLSSLGRLTHERHFNTRKFKREEMYIPGGLVLGLTLSASARDLHEVLHEELVECSFVNHLHPWDIVSSFSYIKEMDENVTGDLEALTIRTIGVKNVDVHHDLLTRPFPLALFTTHSLRTKHVEALCQESMPELSKKIVCVVDRRILRQSPKTEAFLL